MIAEAHCARCGGRLVKWCPDDTWAHWATLQYTCTPYRYPTGALPHDVRSLVAEPAT